MFESVTDNLVGNGDPRVRNLRKTLFGLSIWSAAGLFGLLCFSVSFITVNGWHLGNLAAAIKILGYVVIVAVACIAVGGLIGFLFGIPRTVQSLHVEPRMISLFRLVWDPNDPTKVSAEENDLEVFYADEDFK